MTFVVLCILLCILAELHISRGVKHNGKFQAVATDQQSAKLAELPEVASPSFFLQMHKSGKAREDEHSVETAFASASQLMQQTALPSNMQQGNRESLAQVKGFLKNLAAINQKIAEEATANDNDQPLDGDIPDAPLAENDVKEGNDNLQSMSSAPVTDFLLPDAPGGNSRNGFAQPLPPSSLVQQDAQPLVSSEPSSEIPPLLYVQASAIQRPKVASGKADIVRFGLYGKVFYGTDLKKQEFTIDNIMTLVWKDPRALSVIPSGQESITFTDDEAKSKIWLPEVEITNKVSRDSNLISSSLTIERDGLVTLVERSYVVIKNKFELDQYPFDEQTLTLSIASEKYMLNEVTLLPLEDPEFSGLRDGFFDDEPYEKVDFSVSSYDDVDGLLKKSRGVMEILVQRTPAKYQHTYLFPVLLYSAIACGVFWLPFTPAFVVPRLALSILILLVFSNFAIAADAELPEGAPYNWLDLICYTVQLHMFTVICLNIFTEVAYHTMNCKVTAIHMNNELKMLQPMAIGIAFLLIGIGSATKGALNLRVLTILLPILLFLYLITYATCCATTLSTEVQKHKQQEAEDWKGQYGGSAPYSAESLTPASQPYIS